MSNEITHIGESRKEALLNALRQHLPERKINSELAKKAGRTRQAVYHWRTQQTEVNPVMEKAALSLLKRLNRQAAEELKEARL
jgi:DNA-binding phage protein